MKKFNIKEWQDKYLNEADMIKYKSKDGESKEMEVDSAKMQSDDHPAKQAWLKTQKDGDSGEKEKVKGADMFTQGGERQKAKKAKEDPGGWKAGGERQKAKKAKEDPGGWKAGGERQKAKKAKEDPYGFGDFDDSKLTKGYDGESGSDEESGEGNELESLKAKRDDLQQQRSDVKKDIMANRDDKEMVSMLVMQRDEIKDELLDVEEEIEMWQQQEGIREIIGKTGRTVLSRRIKSGETK